MGFLDQLKDMVKDLNLVDIKGQIADKIGKFNFTLIKININLGGKHYPAPLPPEAEPQKLADTEVTSQLEKEFHQDLNGSITATSTVLGSLSTEAQKKVIAVLAVQSAVHVLSSPKLDPVKDEPVAEVEIEDENTDSP